MRKLLYRKSAAAFRWLHIYLSMLGFGAIMFFAATGITLNHPTWFGGSALQVEDISDKFPSDWLRDERTDLEIAEALREKHQLHGKVTEFHEDELEYMLVYKSPAYAADVFIDRESGDYTVTITSANLIAALNDLHKGRDTSPTWKAIGIDGAALLMILFSLSGFALLFYIKRRRLSGVVTSVIGTLILGLVWFLFVP
ncbi:MAG: peptidase [Planctomycetaceae bacterium]|nr:peptidase [Planctomycetaceae bacterium]